MNQKKKIKSINLENNYNNLLNKYQDNIRERKIKLEYESENDNIDY